MLSAEELISRIRLVNDKWLQTNPWEENTNWATACYFMGCLDAYEETGEQRYLDAAVRWGEEHDWRACVEGNLEYAKNVLVDHFTVDLEFSFFILKGKKRNLLKSKEVTVKRPDYSLFLFPQETVRSNSADHIVWHK